VGQKGRRDCGSSARGRSVRVFGARASRPHQVAFYVLL
jgi:hypothetical protein